jgi:hypothetical protein
MSDLFKKSGHTGNGARTPPGVATKAQAIDPVAA